MECLESNETTLSSVSASDNAIYLTGGTVGTGVLCVDGSDPSYTDNAGVDFLTTSMYKAIQA